MARAFSRRSLMVVAGLLWLSTLLAPVVIENIKVAAAPLTTPRLSWLNAQTIRDENSNTNYLDDNVTGIESTRLYFKSGNPHSCPSSQPPFKLHGHDIKFRDTLDVQGWSSNGTKPGTTANWWWVQESTSSTDSFCTSNLTSGKPVVLQISNQSYATSTYSWISKTTIRHFNMHVGDGDTLTANDQADATYEYDAIAKKFVEKTSSRCKSYINANPASPNNGQLFIAEATDSGCGTNAPITLLLAFPDNAKTDGAISGSSTGDASKESVTCETQGFSLSWIFCPAIDMLANSGDFIFDHLIQPLLRTNPIDYNNSSPLYKIWSSFRLIGNIVLVIALFVIVFSQATGLNMDAYAVKKIMPRLLVAAILMNLSIYLVGLYLDFVNILGEGIRNIMIAPLGDQAHIEPGNMFGGLGLSAIAVTGFGAYILAAGAGAGAFFTILQGFFVLVLLPAFLGALAVLGTLVVRQGILVLGAAVSPVLAALWVLPNTEHIAKKGVSLIGKAGMVYPITVAILGAAQVLAVMMSANKPQGAAFQGLLYDIVAVFVHIAALFAIMFAFKFADQFTAGAFNFIQGHSKRGMEAFKGAPNDPFSWRSRMREKWRGDRTRARSSFVRANAATYGANTAKNEDGSYKYRRGTRTVRGFLGNRLNYGNLKAAESLLNEQAQKIQDTVTGSGDDTDINNRSGVFGRMYDKQTGEALFEKDGVTPMMRWQMLDGNEIAGGEAAVKKARSLYPGQGGLQASVAYRLKKTSTATDAEIFKRNASLLTQYQDVKPEELGGLLTGVGFARQAERLEFKHSTYGKTGVEEQKEYGAAIGSNGYLSVKNKAMDKRNGKNDSFVNEIHNAKGTWAMSQMRDTTIEHLTKIQEHWQEQYKTTSDPEQKALLRGRLKKVYEIGSELAPTTTRRADTPLDEKGMPVAGYGGMQGAPAAVHNAARRLEKTRDTEIMKEIIGDQMVGQSTRQAQQAPQPPAGPTIITPGSPGWSSPASSGPIITPPGGTPYGPRGDHGMGFNGPTPQPPQPPRRDDGPGYGPPTA